MGIDGGGSKTVAWLAACTAGEPVVVGRATAGPSNPQTVGFSAARASLRQAIAAAFADAKLKRRRVAAAVLALAGSDRDENREAIRAWAVRDRWARRLRIVHDAVPLLAAGTPEGWGIALVSGTGSFAFGENCRGESARAGGWGFRFGDEGSGYALGIACLRAAAQAADGRGPATALLPALLKRLRLKRAEELVSATYRAEFAAGEVASLAAVVFDAARSGDPLAQDVLKQAGADLAAMVAAVARRLGLDQEAFPLALGGSILTANDAVERQLLAQLDALGLRPNPVTPVPEPVAGAIRLAFQEHR
jgi:N-acetylglucosamine kinase-like BadF-type ATPase